MNCPICSAIIDARRRSDGRDDLLWERLIEHIAAEHPLALHEVPTSPGHYQCRCGHISYRTVMIEHLKSWPSLFDHFTLAAVLS